MNEYSNIRSKNNLIRNIDAGERLEMFFVTAITSILVIRLFLALTNYPRLGNGELHIAHMLWGGLLMLAALLIRIVYIGRTSEKWMVFLGGVGFGTFIDEVGKFLTSDNDYFFRPAPAIIYMTFIILILFLRLIHRRKYSSREYLLNALKITEELAMNNASPEDTKQAMNYLDQADPSNPLVRLMRDVLAENMMLRTPRKDLLQRIKFILHTTYFRLVRLPGFNLSVTLFFSFQLLTKFTYLFVIVFLKGFKFENIANIGLFHAAAENLNNFTFIEWAEFSSTVISAAFVLWGFLELRKSRYNAYLLFERSVLVNIFITQVFLFYQNQFGALVGLFANLLLLLALRFMIHREIYQQSIIDHGLNPVS